MFELLSEFFRLPPSAHAVLFCAASGMGMLASLIAGRFTLGTAIFLIVWLLSFPVAVGWVQV
jgi:hypothetical protein